jgi:hypothetical protein
MIVKRGADNTELEADGQEDDLGHTAGVHQGPDDEAISPRLPREPGRHRRTAELAERRDDEDEQSDEPQAGGGELVDPHRQRDQDEEDRQQVRHDAVELPVDATLPPPAPWHHRTGQEAAEDSVDSDVLGGPRAQHRDGVRRATMVVRAVRGDNGRCDREVAAV